VVAFSISRRARTAGDYGKALDSAQQARLQELLNPDQSSS